MDLVVHVDHCHISLKIPDRQNYCRWIRALTYALTYKIKDLKWAVRPFFRIARWGKEFEILKNYFNKNRIQVNFIIEARQRVTAWLTQATQGLELRILPATTAHR